MDKIFKGRRLKNARLYRGITIEALAEKIEVTKQAVSQYENDQSSPEFDKIIRIAQALSFPCEYFTQPYAEKVKTGTTYFRSLMKTNSRYRQEQILKIELVAEIFSFLREYVEFPPLKFPQPHRYDSPAHAARVLREYWGIGQSPISDIIRLVEENGIIVTTFSTPTDDIDAFSQFAQVCEQPLYLIAFSKNKDSAARIHFDVAHELGHIMLHTWSEDVEPDREQFKAQEKEANEFAAAFLLPEDAYRSDARHYSTDLMRYEQLKKRWKVSIAAMLYRSRELDLITQHQYINMLRLMQRKGWRKEEPLDKILKTASPSLLRDSVEILLENGVFTASEFMRQLADDGLPIYSAEVEALLDLPNDILNDVREEKPVKKLIKLFSPSNKP